jgi:stage II sporulation protein R
MKKTLILFGGLIVLFWLIKTPGETIFIPKEAIRLRIIANSNSLYDQRIKNTVKEDLQIAIYETLKDTPNIEAAREVLRINLPHFDNTISKTLTKNNYEGVYSIELGNHHFPSKKYKGVVYDEGNYESLLVKLGKGEGDNWWCVLFPPLCLLEAQETSEPEYSFFVKELIKKFIK